MKKTVLILAYCCMTGQSEIPSFAQSLSSISVGDKSSRLDPLGVPPTHEQKMGPHTAVRFELPDGNSLSATYRNSDGTIVFLESDWGGKKSGSFSGFRDFRFGLTSLRDIRSVLGHNGMSFVNGPGTSLTDAGDLIMFNSFEIAKSSIVVTVISKLGAQRLSELSEVYGDQSTAKMISKEAKLDAIIIADMEYRSGIWGDEIVRDGQYLRITRE